MDWDRVTRFDCYELAAQEPWMLARFLRGVHGAEPTVLCEDFCGTAALMRAWIAQGDAFDAIGIDLDAEVLAHAQGGLDLVQGETGRPRGRLVHSDVLKVRDERSDVIAVMNFSICELHDRSTLLRYLKAAHDRLHRGGILVLDLYGGPDALCPGIAEQEIETENGILQYEWEQRSINLVDARVTNAMHFGLPTGRWMRDAFVYDWRLWSVPELTDAFGEAGFGSVSVFEDYGAYLDENGVPSVEPCDSIDEERFVAYIAGRKRA